MNEKIEVDIEPRISKSALSGVEGALKAMPVVQSIASGNITGALKSGLGMAGPKGMLAAGAIEVIESAFAALTKFVSKANPATLQQFDMALEDIQGVIGRFLTPALQAVTPWVRLLGDTLASILPSSRELQYVMKELDPVLSELRKTVAVVAPLIRNELVSALRGATLYLKFFVNALGPFSKLFSLLPQGKLGSSFGAAARGASFLGGAEDIRRGVILGALERGAAEDPQRATAKNTGVIAEKVTAIQNALAKFTGIGGAGVGLRNLFGGPAGILR